MSKVINMLSEAEDWRLTEPFNKGWSHKVIVLYLFGLLLIQVVIGNVAYRQLRKPLTLTLWQALRCT